MDLSRRPRSYLRLVVAVAVAVGAVVELVEVVYVEGVEAVLLAPERVLG